tara:strand:- start:819 stop:1010 length:192 start_codon:yes stop_codon:yes gene_type:complete
METLNDERNIDDIRTLIGTFCFISVLLITFVCVVKCAIKCDESEKNNHLTKIKVKEYEIQELV